MNFEIAGTIVPKARPRVTRNGTYLPQRYREWKDSAIATLKQQTPCDWRPPQPASVQVLLMGTHRGDADNLIGAVLDSLVQSGLLPDDSLTHVGAIALSHCRSCKPRRALITITPQRWQWDNNGVPMIEMTPH